MRVAIFHNSIDNIGNYKFTLINNKTDILVNYIDEKNIKKIKEVNKEIDKNLLYCESVYSKPIKKIYVNIFIKEL
jgi:hypothetical protein